ncbi:iron chelate uptake ABC transporter family permease subunit [Streptomyces sp. NPDC048241]|uniref:iron chelate uptake ABC transporter family permease subunit n=1 Tax=Streptomyces sp. NPDC048241 TaxID=3365521 RepID=UPI003714CD92
MTTKPSMQPTKDEADDSALLPTATPARTRAVVRELLRPHRGLAFAGFGLLVLATSVGLVTQPLLGYIVDLVTEHRAPGTLTWPVAALAGVAVTQGVLTALGMSLVSRLGETVLARLRELFVERALALPLERVERAGSGDLNARVTRDVSRVADAVRGALPELARSALSIVLTLGALALLDWRFLLAALLAVPVQAHTARWYVRNAVPLYGRERIAAGAQQQQLLDTIGGARTVRAHRLQDGHTERVTVRSRAAVELTMRGVRLVLRFYSRLHIAEYLGLAAVLVTGFLLVRSGSASVGTATAAALYFHSLFGPVNTALVLLDDAQSATAGLARLVGVVDEPAAAEAGPAELAAPDPSVTLTGVSHAYVPGRPVLHGVDLEVRPKERVALVGTTGAGKTTLAKLVAGLHSPTAGRVDIGGAGPDVSGRLVGLVTQEVHVFAGPLADDLRLARLPPALALGRLMRTLQLGDDVAAGLGTPVQAVRLALLLTGVGLVAFGTAAAGPVAFVALACPQIAQRVAGTSSPPPLVSGLTGAFTVLGADLLAREAVPGTELPVGIVTGALGAPVLLWLLIRANRAGSGG